MPVSADRMPSAGTTSPVAAFTRSQKLVPSTCFAVNACHLEPLQNRSASAAPWSGSEMHRFEIRPSGRR
jgi:hypothetical protein